MSSYGDDLRCKDLHSTGVVKAQTLTVKKGGNFAGGGAFRTTPPVQGTVGAGFTPGAIGDIVFVGAAPATANNGVWACTTAGGATVVWTHIATKAI